MWITNLKVNHYRSLYDVKLELNRLTAILGGNGVGKSTILYALDTFYDVNKAHTDFDYFNKDTVDKEIRIQITFSELTESELDEFSKYIQDGQLTVTKVITLGGSKYYGVIKQIPEFSEIRKLKGRECSTKFNELVAEGRYEGLANNARSETIAREHMDAYEIDHTDLCEPIESITQFFGPRNIGGGKLDNYTKFVLIPAVRDALDETGKRGAILQLIDLLVMRSINSRDDVIEALDEIDKTLKALYSTENIPELNELASLINDVLSVYAPEAKIDLEFSEIEAPKPKTPETIVSLIEDNFKSPITHVGHGLQRALVIALLQQLAMTDKKIESTDEGEEENVVAEKINLILAIEEPELYLHPSKSRFLSSVFDLLCNHNNENNFQIIYATHSPYFVDLNRFETIRVARKEILRDEIKHTVISEYSISNAIIDLETLNNVTAGTFTEDSFKAHAMPIMTNWTNEGFFSNVVLLVEGPGDVGVFVALQKILDMKWDEKNIVIVPVGGKNNIDRPVLIFNGLNIPTYFVFDSDLDKEGEKLENEIIKNNIYLKLAGENEKDIETTEIFRKCAVLHTKLESYIKSVNEEYYNNTTNIISDEIGINPSQIFKNPEGSSRFIFKAYEDKINYEELESIVEAVTNLIN